MILGLGSGARRIVTRRRKFRDWRRALPSTGAQVVGLLWSTTHPSSVDTSCVGHAPDRQWTWLYLIHSERLGITTENLTVQATGSSPRAFLIWQGVAGSIRIDLHPGEALVTPQARSICISGYNVRDSYYAINSGSTASLYITPSTTDTAKVQKHGKRVSQRVVIDDLHSPAGSQNAVRQSAFLLEPLDVHLSGQCTSSTGAVRLVTV